MDHENGGYHPQPMTYYPAPGEEYLEGALSRPTGMKDLYRKGLSVFLVVVLLLASWYLVGVLEDLEKVERTDWAYQATGLDAMNDYRYAACAIPIPSRPQIRSSKSLPRRTYGARDSGRATRTRSLEISSPAKPGEALSGLLHDNSDQLQRALSSSSRQPVQPGHSPWFRGFRRWPL